MKEVSDLKKKPISLKETEKTGAIMLELTKRKALSDGNVSSETDCMAVLAEEDEEQSESGTPPGVLLDPSRGYSTMDYRRGRPFFQESPLNSPKTCFSPRESAPSRRRIDVSRLIESSTNPNYTMDLDSAASTLDDLRLSSAACDLSSSDIQFQPLCVSSPASPPRRSKVTWLH